MHGGGRSVSATLTIWGARGTVPTPGPATARIGGNTACLEVRDAAGHLVILDAGTGQILGAAVLGMEGGEMMAMLQIAMMGRIAYPVLRDAIFAHPTLAEALNNVFVSLDSSEMEAQPQAMQKEHFQ